MSFALTWWPLSIAALLALLALAGYGWVRRGRREQAVLIAHSQRLTQLPAYRAALRRRRRSLGALAGLLACVLVPLALAAGRPADVRTVDPASSKRDIMLCLDVSGSMIATDQAILQSFAEIVQNFEGERVGLVLFNNQAVTAFPLTDDYELITEQLTGYAEGFQFFGSGEYDPLAGTVNERIPASSLVPDGLASCVSGFDHRDQERPRAMILGTDNDVYGEGIYTMEEAVELAKEAQVRVYALNPMADGLTAGRLADAAEETGGRAWEHSDQQASKDITAEIERLEAARLPDEEQVSVQTDRPAAFVALAAIALLGHLGAAAWGRR